MPVTAGANAPPRKTAPKAYTQSAPGTITNEKERSQKAVSKPVSTVTIPINEDRSPEAKWYGSACRRCSLFLADHRPSALTFFAWTILIARFLLSYSATAD